MQPVFTQVPPNSWRSMSATVMPAAVSRPASGGPAWPAPMMIASNWFTRPDTLITIGQGGYGSFASTDRKIPIPERRRVGPLRTTTIPST